MEIHRRTGGEAGRKIGQEKMNGLPYYKRYPRDFIEGTIGMPLELKGPYSILIDLIYMQNGNLPDDARYISGLLGCSARQWLAIRMKLLDTGKIVATDGYLRNYRADNELLAAKLFQSKQAANGRRNNKNNGLPETVAEPKVNHTDTDKEEEKEIPNGISKKKGSRLPDDWRLPRAWGEWALAEKLPEADIRAEADKFRDYWHGESGSRAVKTDWQAVWRNWVRKAVADRWRFQRPASSGHSVASGRFTDGS